jgi:hypothetical protein
MALTVFLILALIAVALTVYHATKPPFPLWPAVFVICLIELLRDLPLGGGH